MKKNIFLTASLFTLLLIACGPAAEDRDAMQGRAKIIADSIANSIKSKMAEAEFQGPNIIKVDTAKPAAVDTTKKSK